LERDGYQPLDSSGANDILYAVLRLYERELLSRGLKFVSIPDGEMTLQPVSRKSVYLDQTWKSLPDVGSRGLSIHPHVPNRHATHFCTLGKDAYRNLLAVTSREANLRLSANDHVRACDVLVRSHAKEM
jgi:hypothetical protein